MLASEDTQVNILKQLREQSSIRPFEEKMVSTSKDNLLDDMDIPSFVLPEDDTLRNTISMEVKQLLDQSGNSGEMLKTLEPAPTPEIKKSRRMKPPVEEETTDIQPIVDDEDDEEDDDEWDDEDEEETKKPRWKLFGRRRDEDDDEDADDDM